MFDAYVKIFTRFGLKFRPVAADNGAIGGSGSHEFHVIAETGEDALVYSRESEYAANMEAAIALPPSAERAAATRSMQKVATPGQKACEDVTNFLNQPLSQSLKVIAAIRTDIAAGEKGHFVVILMRGDHDLNEVKTQKIIGEFRFASESEIIHHLGCPAGYLGPIGLEKREDIALYADHAVTVMSDFICGANEKDMHFTGVNWERDLPLPENIADFRNVVEGEPISGRQGNAWPFREVLKSATSSSWERVIPRI